MTALPLLPRAALGIVLAASPVWAAPVTIDFEGGSFIPSAASSGDSLDGTWEEEGFAIGVRGERVPGADPEKALGTLSTGPTGFETQAFAYDVQRAGGFAFRGLDLGSALYSGLGWRYGVDSADGSERQTLVSFSPAIRLVGTTADGGTIEQAFRPATHALPDEGEVEDASVEDGFVDLAPDAAFDAAGTAFDGVMLNRLGITLLAGGNGCAEEQLSRVTLVGFQPEVACGDAEPMDRDSFVTLEILGGRNDAAFLTVDALRLDTIAPIPLPAGGWLLLAGLGGLAAARGRRRP